MTAKIKTENGWLEGISTTALNEEFKVAFQQAKIRPRQEQALQAIADNHCRMLLEMPTGEGKSDTGMACLIGLSQLGFRPLYYITPTKGQVQQITNSFGDHIVTILGRNEYPCLYYDGKVSAEESPCYMLECPHRVNQETGETFEEKAEPCPYYQAKFKALQGSLNGKIVVCTSAFFLVNRILVPKWQEMVPACTVIDEAHNMAKTARRIFEYTVTDYHLFRCVDLVRPLDNYQAEVIEKFVKKFKQICYSRKANQQKELLHDIDLHNLIQIIDKLNPSSLEKKIRQAVKNGRINPVAQKGDLKTLENLVLRIPKLIRSLRFALAGEKRSALNYVIAFYYKVNDPDFADSNKKARFFLTVRSYYVVPVIRKALGPNGIIAYSATVGEPRIMANETGLDLPFQRFNSSFDISKTKVFLPTDTPDLALKKRRRNDLNRSLRTIIRAALEFKKKGIRSLVVVVSEMERTKFLQFAGEEGLEAISYGNGLKAKEAMEIFKNGEGDILIGTAAQYAEGLDLPNNIAQVIFFLRPGYTNPNDPEAQFEERRFPNNHVWALRKWRVMVEALQVRGRNIRTPQDMGVCFFISQGFKSFLFNSLPQWLQPAYCNKLTMNEAIEESIKILS